MNLGEIPQWKKELAERSRLRKETPERVLNEMHILLGKSKEQRLMWQSLRIRKFSIYCHVKIRQKLNFSTNIYPKNVKNMLCTQYFS